MGVDLLFCVDSNEVHCIHLFRVVNNNGSRSVFCVDSTEAIYYIYLFRIVISNGSRSVFCVDSTEAIYYTCSELLSAMGVGLLFCVDCMKVPTLTFKQTIQVDTILV